MRGTSRFAIYDSTNSVERLSILNNGNVGIGTTGPGYKLEVSGGTNGGGVADLARLTSAGNTVGDEAGLAFGLSGATTGRISNYYQVSGYGLKFYTWNASALTAQMVIDKTGNVGIGTTTPVSIAEIQGGLTTVGAVLTLSSKETSTVVNDVLGQINFRAALDVAGGDAVLTGASIAAIAEGTFSATNNATTLTFQTGASEVATTKMTISSAGLVTIGTATQATVSAAGVLTVANTTASTTTTTGCATFAGGIGVVGAITTTNLTCTNAIAGSVTGNAATVTTNANLSGHITSVGNTTSLGSFTLAQLSTAVSDADVAPIGSPTFTGTVTIPTGASITTPTITKPAMDATNPTAQTYTPAGAGTATLDCSLANQHDITMPAGNITIALSNITLNQCIMVSITQDGTGSRTVTWFSTIRWAGGSAPTLTTTASKRDVVGFRRTGTNTYDGFVIGQNI